VTKGYFGQAEQKVYHKEYQRMHTFRKQQEGKSQASSCFKE